MIFISYSWKQAEQAEHLVRFFRESQLQYWIDREHLDLSRDIRSEIAAAVRGSHILLHLESTGNRVSPWVEFEIGMARAAGKLVHSVSSDQAAEAHNKRMGSDLSPASILSFLGIHAAGLESMLRSRSQMAHA